MKQWRSIIFVAAALLVVAPHSVSAASRHAVLLSKQRVMTKRNVVRHRGMQLRIPKKALRARTRVQLSRVGELSTTDDPQPPSAFRTRSDVYAYAVDGTPKKPLRVRLRFNFDEYGKRRKTILFLPDGGKKWKALPTTMYRRKNQLHAQLPSARGQVMVATHKRKREAPKRRNGFAYYGGAPYSDKVAVMDVESGKWLYTKKANKPQHIASITKLATVYTFLGQQPELTDVVSYATIYERIGATVEIEEGDRLRLVDALYSTLMPSANNMAMLLSYNSGMTQSDFVEQMNTIADELNAGKTHFTEPTGLDDGNVSTPKNMARFALHVFQTYPRFFQNAADLNTYSYRLRNRDKRLTVESTNTFDGKGKYHVKAFKTGYYPGTAERTLAIWIEPTHGKGEIMVVLFGNPEYGTINDEAYEIADWAFTNWRFHNY